MLFSVAKVMERDERDGIVTTPGKFCQGFPHSQIIFLAYQTVSQTRVSYFSALTCNSTTITFMSPSMQRFQPEDASNKLL
jgi:hypothetical protein